MSMKGRVHRPRSRPAKLLEEEEEPNGLSVQLE